MQSIYFGWLKIILSEYEREIGDGKGNDLWNWCMERYNPEDILKILSEEE
jgi:hypothetical protein